MVEGAALFLQQGSSHQGHNAPHQLAAEEHREGGETPRWPLGHAGRCLKPR